MGRKKIYTKRFLIGLDEIQAGNLRRMCEVLSLTYSEAVSYLIDYYQLGLGKEGS